VGADLFTGAHCNGEPVCVRRTLKCKHFKHYELVAAIGEGSPDCESRFTRDVLIESSSF
jgi:hypothetical protein